MVRQLLTALAAALLISCAHAQAPDAPAEANASAADRPAPDLLDRLVGQWVLTGTIAGQDTVHDVQAEWVLQQTYVRISEVSSERDESGRPVYEAIVFVGWLNDHYVCLWLDNTEVASGEITCAAAAAPDSIPFEFRDAQGALIFTNTFSYHRADDTWNWLMVNTDGETLETFAEVTLRRP